MATREFRGLSTLFSATSVLFLFFAAAHSKPANFEEMLSVPCEYKGLTFWPGEGRYLDHVGCKVSVVKCSPTGETNVIQVHDCSYESSEQGPPPSQDAITTTPHPKLGPVCHYEGTFYRPGEMIHQGNHKGFCFGVYCSKELKVVEFNGVKCNATFTEVTPDPPVVNHFLEIGCEVDGMLYEPGEIITRDQHKDRCFESFCQEDVVKKREIAGLCEDIADY